MKGPYAKYILAGSLIIKSLGEDGLVLPNINEIYILDVFRSRLREAKFGKYIKRESEMLGLLML